MLNYVCVVLYIGGLEPSCWCYDDNDNGPLEESCGHHCQRLLLLLQQLALLPQEYIYPVYPYNS